MDTDQAEDSSEVYLRVSEGDHDGLGSLPQAAESIRAAALGQSVENTGMFLIKQVHRTEIHCCDCGRM